jgi:iron complex outermembrane receptor protein
LNVKSITAWRSLKTNELIHSVGEGRLVGLVLDPTTFTVSPQRVSPYAIEPNLFGDPNGILDHQHQFSEEVQVSGEIGRHKYVGGLYYFTETFSENYAALITLLPYVNPELGFLPPGIALNSPAGLDYDGISKSYAAYLSDTYRPPILNDQLEITGGARYTIDKRTVDYLADPLVPQPFTHKYKKSTDVSGDVTVKYNWTEDVNTYIRFANAYKSGGFDGRDDYRSPGYNPETANNFEGGVKGDFFDRTFRANADVFYTKYLDKQISTFLNIPGLPAPVSHVANAGTAQYLGSEVELTYVPTKQWEFEASWGHTWPKFLQFNYQPVTNGPTYNIAGAARFPYFSKSSFSLAAQYNLEATPIGDLSVRLDYSYKSPIWFHPSLVFNPHDAQIKSGAQTLLNGNVALAHIPVALGKTDLALSVYGTNLLNKEFRVQGTDFGALGFANIAFNRPRVVGVNLTASY